MRAKSVLLSVIFSVLLAACQSSSVIEPEKSASALATGGEEASPVYMEQNYADGGRYKGYFVNGKRHGRGVYLYPDGSKYEGEWVAGEKHGYGVSVSQSGHVYQGNWRNGIRHGKGKLIYADGGIHEGYWVEGRPIPAQGVLAFLLRVEYFLERGPAVIESLEFKRNFYRLLNDPQHPEAQVYFGLAGLPGIGRELLKLKNNLTNNGAVSVSEYINSPRFYNQLKFAIDAFQADFFDLKPYSPSPDWMKACEDSKKVARMKMDEILDSTDFVLQILDVVDTDIQFIPAPRVKQDHITLCYQGSCRLGRQGNIPEYCDGGQSISFPVRASAPATGLALIEAISRLKPTSSCMDARGCPLDYSYAEMRNIYKQRLARGE